MTISQVSYTPFPVPDKSDLPIASSPTGTIYMGTRSKELDLHYAGNPNLHPEPTCYFESEQRALSAFVPNRDSKPEYVGQTGMGSCSVWSSINAWGETYYIYVWAIAPAGGAG